MYLGLLEDDAHVAQYVRQLLEGTGHTVRIFDNGNALIQALTRDRFDLFILDWWVPEKNGLQVLQHIREVLKIRTPVIFLTSRTEEKDVVNALTAGADDYCTKPIQADLLLARIAALLRRSYPQPSQQSVRELLGYHFEMGSHTVRFNATQVNLTDKEFVLALHFFDNAEAAISRKELLYKFWGQEDLNASRSLDVHVSVIRRKLMLSSPQSTVQLRPVYGFGYRLVNVSTQHDD